MAIQIVSTGVNTAAGAASVVGTVPLNSAGMLAKFIRISVTSPIYFRLGAGAPVAASTDALIHPAECLILATLGLTNFAALGATSETRASNEQSIATTGTTSSNTINWAAVSGATGYRIYRGITADGQNTFYTVGPVVTFLDVGAAGTAGTPLLAGGNAALPPVQAAPATSITGGTLAAATYFYKVSAIMPSGIVQVSPVENPF